MMNAVRAELIKMRSMPGVWVTFALAFPLSVLVCIGVLASAGGFPGHTFYYVQTLHQRRQLLGAGYFGIEILAPIWVCSASPASTGTRRSRRRSC